MSWNPFPESYPTATAHVLQVLAIRFRPRADFLPPTTLATAGLLLTATRVRRSACGVPIGDRRIGNRGPQCFQRRRTMGVIALPFIITTIDTGEVIHDPTTPIPVGSNKGGSGSVKSTT